MQGLTSYELVDRDTGLYEYSVMLQERLKDLLPHLGEAGHEDFQVVNYAAYALVRAGEEIGRAFNLCQLTLNTTMKDFSQFLSDFKDLQNSMVELQDQRGQMMEELARKTQESAGLIIENQQLRELVGCLQDLEQQQGNFKVECDHAMNMMQLQASKQQELS